MTYNQWIYLSYFYILLLGSFLSGCREKSPTSGPNKMVAERKEAIPDNNRKDIVFDYDTSQWIEITTANSGILLDIRYATENNFTEKVIYDCGRCFLRPEIAWKLIALNKGIAERYNLRLRVFDCYRPQPAQQKLWDIVPDARYVTPPDKGSMHNRGMAVDLTLSDYRGQELDMGTPYDFFGRAAHTDHDDLPEEVLRNRRILQTMMKEIGFRTIRTEWWHFSYAGESWDLSSWEWACD